MVDVKMTFNNFEVALAEDGLTNVVKSISWTLRANDDGIIDSVTATTGLESPDPNNFTNFDDITEQWAIEVVSSKVDVEAIKVGILSSIERQKQIVRKTPPFLIPPDPPPAEANT
jgi:hypothetical protein